METVVGDIWQLSRKDDSIVVPTNIGWKLSDGKNVMGAGIARQLTRRMPWAALSYGQYCKQHGPSAPVCMMPGGKWGKYIILLPVKPLNLEQPYRSWQQPACLRLIERSLRELQAHAESDEHTGGYILVPSVGCGNGGLAEGVVVPLLHSILTHPSFVHVRYDTGGGAS